MSSRRQAKAAHRPTLRLALGLRACGVVCTQYTADPLRKGYPNHVVLILAAQLDTLPRAPIGSESNLAAESARPPVYCHGRRLEELGKTVLS